MRICINKITDKIIEVQSGGESEEHLNTLHQNAINAGYNEADIEVNYVTDTEYQAILEAKKPEPTYADLRQAEYPKINDLMVALWEDVVEGRPEARILLQAERETVKFKYPKA